MRAGVWGLLFLLSLGVAPVTAMAAPDCPDGNMLSGITPKVVNVSRAARLSDGVAAKEGDEWNTNVTAVLRGSAAHATWDLGREVKIGALLVQGDNNDTYVVSASSDGITFHPLWTVPQAPQPGMRMRVHQGAEATTRYLRVGEAKGDNAYSIGEIQAFCAQPAVWPPALKREGGKSVSKKDSRKRVMAFAKMTFGLLGLLVFLGLAVARRDPGPHTRTAAYTWAALSGAAFVFLDRQGYAEPAVAAVGHFAAAMVVLWALGREVPQLERIGRLIAVAAAVAVTTYIGWRTRAYLLPNTLDAVRRAEVLARHPVRANLHLIFLGISVALAAWGTLRARAQKSWRPIVDRAVMVAVLAAGTLTWTNLWSFHGSRAVHYWDSFHYYMGSKYFEETRYHLLYQCSAIGEVDDGRKKEFEKRQIRDLRNNVLSAAMPQLTRDEECRKNFTPERWAAFRQDLRLFRSQMGGSWWGKMFKDHGYNASPVWNMVGNFFANWDWREHIPPEGKRYAPVYMTGKSTAERRAIRAAFNNEQVPAFKARIARLALLDGALYVGIFLLIFWAFGLEICALAMVVFAAGYPWAYFWTGGGFGRVPWLFMAVAGVCCMRRGYMVLGGFGVTWAALLRVFPGALAGGVFLKFVYNGVRHRMLTRAHKRIIIGAVLAVAVLVPMSLPSSDGPAAYGEFIGNSMKHKKTPLTNHMGMPSLFAWGPKLIARHTKNAQLADPFAVWKQKKVARLHEMRWFFRLGILGLLGLVLLAGRKMPDWEATAISAVLIIGIFDLTCYYYNFIVLLAPTAIRRLRSLVVLVVMAIASQVVQLRVGWYDEQYLWETVLVLVAVLYIIGDFAWQARKEPDHDQPDPEQPDPGDAEPAPA